MFFSSACALVWFKSDCIINWGERKVFGVYNTDLILLKFTSEGIYTSLIDFTPFSSFGRLSLLNEEDFYYSLLKIYSLMVLLDGFYTGLFKREAGGTRYF